MELKSLAMREGPWRIHHWPHVVTKLMHQQLGLMDPCILAQCSIMGSRLDVAMRNIKNGTPHYPNRNLLAKIEVLATQIEIHCNWDSTHKMQLPTTEIYLGTTQINSIAAECEVPRRIFLPSVKFRRGYTLRLGSRELTIAFYSRWPLASVSRKWKR